MDGVTGGAAGGGGTGSGVAGVSAGSTVRVGAGMALSTLSDATVGEEAATGRAHGGNSWLERRAPREGQDERREEQARHGASGAAGSVSVTVVPLPTCDSTSMRPSCICTMRYTMARPMPDPPVFVV